MADSQPTSNHPLVPRRTKEGDGRKGKVSETSGQDGVGGDGGGN